VIQTHRAAVPTRPDELDQPVVVRSHRYPEANAHGAHSHRKAQLVWSHDGVVTVSTTAGSWVVPPRWAVWVTSWLEHDVQARGECTMHGVYVEPGQPGAPTAPGAVSVTPLLRELLLSLLEVGDSYQLDGPHGRLAAVVLDQLVNIDRAPVRVPVVRDPLLLPIASAASDDARTLAEWGRELGASERTLARRFRADTGLTFGQWRTQARLAAALQLLAGDASIGVTARSVGYSNQSAFIEVFRRTLGVTPARYFAPPT
jgi:AraC-like DNA-binding protein